MSPFLCAFIACSSNARCFFFSFLVGSGLNSENIIGSLLLVSYVRSGDRFRSGSDGDVYLLIEGPVAFPKFRPNPIRF